MRRAAVGFVGVIAVWIAAGVAAQAGGKHENWKAVERLAPGVPVVVEQRQGVPEDCLMVAADDASLTCERDPDPNVDWGPGAKARVVFPRQAVREVWYWAPPTSPHIGIWIGAAVGFVIGAAACAEGGPGTIVGCGFVGALIVAGIVAAAELQPPPMLRPWGLPPPVNYPQRPRAMERKLVYRAPLVDAGRATRGAEGAS